MAICNGQKPEEQNFEREKMREHLRICLEMGVMRHFPARPHVVKDATKKRETVNVFCSCRLPEDGHMIACENCQKWFHSTCINAPEEAWSSQHYKWFCATCS